MSSGNFDKSDLGKRIISLSSLFTSDKEFLKKCDISNKSLLADLKSGRSKNPKSEYLEKIVRGTGVSGTWLLTGEGEKFEGRRNNGSSIAAEPQVEYAVNLLNRIEQQKGELKDIELPEDIEIQLTRLLLKVLERRKAS